MLPDRGVAEVSLALIVFGWMTAMRLVRSTVVSVKEADYVQAARALGASTWRIAVSIVAPILRPVLAIVTIQSIIWDFKVFTQIYVMTGGGGIAGQNLVLNVYSYQQAFAASQYGLGSAVGVITTMLLMVVTLAYLRALRRQGEEL